MWPLYLRPARNGILRPFSRKEIRLAVRLRYGWRSASQPLRLQGMPTYLVDRNLPGLTREQFRAAQRALGHAARRAERTGQTVRYLRALFVPSEGRAICVFEAPDSASVRAVNQAAGVPFSHVAEAIDLIAEPDHFPEEGLCAHS